MTDEQKNKWIDRLLPALIAGDMTTATVWAMIQVGFSERPTKEQVAERIDKELVKAAPMYASAARMSEVCTEIEAHSRDIAHNTSEINNIRGNLRTDIKAVNDRLGTLQQTLIDEIRRR